MKIFNQNKTQELTQTEIDFSLGYLKEDKLFIEHHAATPFIKGKSAEELADEKRAQGIKIFEKNGKFYTVDKEYENGGRSVTEIRPETDVQAKEAWDKYEAIKVFIPYTEEELKERRLNALRARRAPLLESFDKWEKAVLRGREYEDAAIDEWYHRLLDLEELAFENIPKRIQYFL